ncbi:peptidylprolyl isomerase [Streptomonospora wellingtoniae]|uniref:Peptidyl-prolyl cis-trans isomerase n=1 Tax=Streptomonospora wellingtoniae TaxID=3075544 RepID=A0ABU2KXH3_9ACTN|nr:peptidylprolyl isomerase [Streptomonospora sp. DSM 45055]MDT0303942.1 peptidylprolyl isomerase [Streptomonospora sp. DSM 45055]
MSEVKARLNTNQGTIVAKLFAEQAPETVENFVGLAEGTKQWIDPTTGKPSTAPLYNGTIFHRVIDGFMIQGGDPLGNGRGGPGYKFKDEFDPSVKFDRPYLLAMANAGPNTNGSQFFVTVGTPDWLNRKHTIFGEVVSGTEIIDKISKVATNAQDRPLEDVTVESVEIERS